MLTAVDSSSDESVKSAPAAVTISAAQSSSSGGGGGCFIASVGWDLLPDPLKPLTALALLICLGWRRGGGAALCALRSMSPAAIFEERGCATRGALGGKPPRLRVLPKRLRERQR